MPRLPVASAGRGAELPGSLGTGKAPGLPLPSPSAPDETVSLLKAHTRAGLAKGLLDRRTPHQHVPSLPGAPCLAPLSVRLSSTSP